MKVVVLLFHPDFAHSKVNRAFVNALPDIVTVRNEYELYPDFKIDVKAEQQALTDADRIVIEYPIYWYNQPALLALWEEKVLTSGWAFGKDVKPALAHKDLMVAVSCGSNAYGRQGFIKYTVTELLRPLQAMARALAVRYVSPFITTNTYRLSSDQLAKRAQSYVSYVTTEDELPVLGDFG